MQGDLPGNQVDAAPHVSLSTTAFNFTSDNWGTNAQPLEVTSVGACWLLLPNGVLLSPVGSHFIQEA